MLALASQCNSSNDVAFCRSYIMVKFTGPKSDAHELHSDYENFKEKKKEQIVFKILKRPVRSVHLTHRSKLRITITTQLQKTHFCPFFTVDNSMVQSETVLA